MVSNGCQYGYFIEKNCCNCTKYVTTEEHEETGKDYCQIENIITLGCVYFDLSEKKMIENEIDPTTMTCKSFQDRNIDKIIEGQIKIREVKMMSTCNNCNRSLNYNDINEIIAECEVCLKTFCFDCHAVKDNMCFCIECLNGIEEIEGVEQD